MLILEIQVDLLEWIQTVPTAEESRIVIDDIRISDVLSGILQLE